MNRVSGPSCDVRLCPRRRRARWCRGINIENGRAGDFGEGLHQFGDAGEAGFGVVPVALIEDLVVGSELQGAGVALDQLDETGGVGETVVAQ